MRYSVVFSSCTRTRVRSPCSIDENDIIGQVALFFQQNLDLAMLHLKMDEEIHLSYVDTVLRIFAGDTNFQRFYSKSAHIAAAWLAASACMELTIPLLPVPCRYGVLGTEKKVDGKWAVRPVSYSANDEPGPTRSSCPSPVRSPARLLPVFRRSR